MYKSFIKQLIDHNADVNLVTKDGLSPIFLALANKNAIATRYLLENPKLDLSLTTQEGDTIFHYLSKIALDDDFKEIFQLITDLLKDSKKALNTPNMQGKTGLHALVEAISSAYSVALPVYISEFEQEIVTKKQTDIGGKAKTDESDEED